MKIIYLFSLSALISIFSSPAYSQLNRLRNKIENKVEDAAVDAIFGNKKDKNSTSEDDYEYTEDEGTSGSRTRARNKGGAGLTSTPPDVNKYLAEAETSFAGSEFGKA